VIFMNTYYDIQQFLKRYGTIIYTGDRIGDCELMEMEIEELLNLQIIEKETYMKAKLVLRREKAKARKK